jgi:glycerol-3-phosphate dehydrogenase
LTPFLPVLDKPSWTGGTPLPGGDFPVQGYEALVRKVAGAHPYAPDALVRRLVRAYGTDAQAILDGATSLADLGPCFGATLYEREVRWLIEHEFATAADDVLWRRSKLGLRLTPDERAALAVYMQAAPKGPVSAAA